MTKKKLDLVKLPSGEVAKTRTGASQIVGCEFIDSGSLGRTLDDFSKHLRSHAVAPDLS